MKQITQVYTGAAPLSYLWDFGDGSAGSTEENPILTYSAAGTYTVSLTAANDFGSDTAEQTIFVGFGTTAGFVHNGPIYVWETAVFTNTSTGSAPLSYLWEFGDGTTSTAENPSHQFLTAGVYTVTLTVANVFGMDVFVATVVVREATLYMPAVFKP